VIQVISGFFYPASSIDGKEEAGVFLFMMIQIPMQI
jgi:hypothetical protein